MVMWTICPQLNHLTMIGNGVTFTSIYKPKMAKQGCFFFIRKTQVIRKKTKQNQDTVCELKKFRLNSKNEIIINDQLEKSNPTSE